MKMLTEVLEDENRRGNRAPGMAGGMKKNHHFSWENPGFLWQCSIAMFVVTL
jgi:hypothetical protein